MKGYTDIELTNVKTGEVKKYHDENMLTNGVMHALSQNPYCFGTFHENRGQIMQDKPPSWLLMGGLLLFDKQLEENPETLVPPDGVKMVGNAVAGVSNASGVPEFGNFDTKASTYEVSGKTAVQKFVYTFDTTQANGTIASICLASAQAGYYGFGNHSGQKITNSDDWRFRENPFPHGGIPFNPSYASSNSSYQVPVLFNNGEFSSAILTDYNKNFAVLINNAFFEISYDTQNAKLILGKMHIPLSKTGAISLSPFVYPSKNYIYEKVEVPLPDMVLKTLRGKIRNSDYRIITDEGKGYVIWIGFEDEKKDYSKPAFYLLEITSDLQVNFKRVIPNDNNKAVYNQSSGTNYSAIKNGTLLVMSQEYNNSTREFFLNEIDIETGRNTKHKSPPITGIGKYMDKIVVAGENQTVYIYDTILKKFLLINANSVNLYRQIKGAKHLLTDGVRFYTAPAYLATINNLSEPVTKTPELVMKITYTLTTELEA